ncbi:HEAT repeat domain-containing protein [Halalkalibacter kiskunsagensis]|uniref:HEAT repeat domain-containing protein n=1 Tax=Halalkalibacter kiskunsagensis TaxID=1548599 RepID=A0ABV6KFP8_9BACI
MNSTKNQKLLNDEQMRKFITDGFLLLETDFSSEFHQQLTKQLDMAYHDGNPGNNLLPKVPELQRVFDHPVITGGLTSVLGENYMLHAHRHGHFNAAPKAGGWHKDSYWGYRRMRNHHPWWAMIMYFPQDTPIELGPTGIMPGTQNYESRIFPEDETEEEILASGKAGTFALIHYDIWHRANANQLGKSRYMLKFEFMRTEVPVAPTWDNQEVEWKKTDTSLAPLLQQEVMWEETWNWLTGKLGSIANTTIENEGRIQELANLIEDDFEPNALRASYELARSGKRGVDTLLMQLHHENVAVSRIASYGLSVSGKDSIPGLVKALESSRPETVIHAAFALGEHRHLAREAVPELNRLLEHASVHERRTIVESLGMIKAPEEEVVIGLIKCLQDQDTQVRFMAGLSLCRLGATAEKAVPELEIALDDDNRYVRAHAAEALRYIGTEQAKDVLLKYLFNTRWCASTTAESTF